MKRFANAGLLVLSLVMASALTANATSLLVNGDFETGDMTGWTLSGNTGFTGINGPGSPHGGSYYMAFGAIGSDSIFVQSSNFATTPGGLYEFSFWVQNLSGGTNDFSAYWDGGAALLSLANAGAFGYTQYTFSVVGTGSDNIEFDVRNDPSWYNLDDVSVNAATVPEPGSMMLLGTGLLGLASRMRRRK